MDPDPGGPETYPILNIDRNSERGSEEVEQPNKINQVDRSARFCLRTVPGYRNS